VAERGPCRLVWEQEEGKEEKKLTTYESKERGIGEGDLSLTHNIKSEREKNGSRTKKGGRPKEKRVGPEHPKGERKKKRRKKRKKGGQSCNDRYEGKSKEGRGRKEGKKRNPMKEITNKEKEKNLLREEKKAQETHQQKHTLWTLGDKTREAGGEKEKISAYKNTRKKKEKERAE